MAEIHSKSLLHQPNQAHALQSLLNALDPVSLLRSQNQQNPPSSCDGGGAAGPLRLITDVYVMERGPRYNAYAELRESRLLMKHARQYEPEDGLLKLSPPPKKQVKFQPSLATGRRGRGGGGASLLAQSVPDFSAALRKENRKPPTAAGALPTLIELTPPSSKSGWSKANNACGSGARGSKSVGAAVEKKKGRLMARKSYASVEELKGLSCAVASAINGDERGRNGTIGRGGGNGVGRTILGYRKF